MKLHLIPLLALVTLGVSAQADVRVSFAEPAKFSDIRDNNGFSRTDVLKDIEAHLAKQAAKLLPGMDVSFEVTDLDLAGEIEPLWGRGQWLRVIRPVTVPGISFSYEVREAGKVVRQGQAKLRDLSYQDGFNPYSSSDPLRYERRMIDRLLDREFNRPVAQR